ncbi:MAG: acetyl-CoA carboxylase biotin carboxyl carrier protein [Alphaproteobacteria bacterium]|nr:acetyl-CoA carboxylase biotin carboxyl carrier protein [Alphaproteobacteria bacterium]
MAKLDVDPDLIRRLAELLRETGLAELEVTEGERRLRVRLPETITAVSAPAAPMSAPAAAAVPAPSGDGPPAGAVTSPMVGTVFVAPEPGAAPFVAVGDKVIAGQTLLIVEAMKVMNQIPAPRAGTVTRILIRDRQPVEYGEPLMIVE